jgi:hypothetical protein
LAGWDHDFEVDARDIELLRDCLRVLRRTCARHRIDFTYYASRSPLPSGRARFVLQYDLQSANAPLAAAEFIVEMRAISTIQHGRRQRELPLRLMRDMVWVNTPDAVADQIDPDLVPESARPEAARILERYQAAASSFGRDELPAADMLDAQHSLITDLALLLVPGATTRDSFPVLVRGLIPDSELANQAQQLGIWRNRVKHRRQAALADQVVDEGSEIVWRVAVSTTGAYVDPVSGMVRTVEADPGASFRLPPMHSRRGTLRRPHR